MTLLLSDDHPIVIDTLTRLAPSLGFSDVVHLMDANRLTPEIKPDLAILDMCTHGVLTGPQLAAAIKRRRSQARIMFFTSAEEYPYGVLAKQRGYSGWLHKTAPIEIVKEAIATVAAGGEWFPKFVDDLAAQRDAARLSRRETEVLRTLGLGVTRDADIANALHISEATVRSHIHNICHKLELKNKGDLLQWAVARVSFL